LSAYIVNEKTIQCAVHAIARLPSGKFAGISLPSDWTTAAAVALYSTIGAELWRHNALAVGGRYAGRHGGDPDALPDFRFNPNLNPTEAQQVGAFACTIYQCAEDPVVTTPFYAALEAVEQELGRVYPEVKGTWGILDDEIIPLAEGANAAEPTPNAAASDRLIAAAERGDAAEIVRHLKSGADVNALDNHGLAPLTIAAVAGHAEAVSVLLGAGADPSVGDGEPLAESVRVGHADVVRRLLAGGANPDSLGGRRVPPLGLAVAYERPECAALLLDAGATITDRIRQGADATGHREIVGLIAEATADRAMADRLSIANRKDGGAQADFDFGGERKP